MLGVIQWLHERAKDIAAAILGLMFLTFMAQILFRYVLNLPLDWTLELCLTLWLWTVFWGTAFLLEDEDHVRFDIVYRLPRREGPACAVLHLVGMHRHSFCSVAARNDFLRHLLQDQAQHDVGA